MPNINLEISCSSFPKVDAGMTIITSGKKWTEREKENNQDVKKIFTTKSGTWVFVSDGTLTKLNNSDGAQVGTLNDFDPSRPGSSGTGFAVESDKDFDWTVIRPHKAPRRAKAKAAKRTKIKASKQKAKARGRKKKARSRARKRA